MEPILRARTLAPHPAPPRPSHPPHPTHPIPPHPAHRTLPSFHSSAPALALTSLCVPHPGTSMISSPPAAHMERPSAAAMVVKWGAADLASRLETSRFSSLAVRRYAVAVTAVRVDEVQMKTTPLSDPEGGRGGEDNGVIGP